MFRISSATSPIIVSVYFERYTSRRSFLPFPNKKKNEQFRESCMCVYFRFVKMLNASKQTNDHKPRKVTRGTASKVYRVKGMKRVLARSTGITQKRMRMSERRIPTWTMKSYDLLRICTPLSSPYICVSADERQVVPPPFAKASRKLVVVFFRIIVNLFFDRITTYFE